jgi:catalase (peroxidase I)
MSEELFAIAAFQVPNPRSTFYRNYLTKEQLLKAVELAIERGANVISIRKVVKQ